MKKILLMLAAIALISLPLIISSCDEEYVCKSATNSCGTFEACCTATDCYYLYNGKKYHCDGTNCTSAAERLVADMCSKSAIDVDDYAKFIEEQTSIVLQVMSNK